VRLLEDNIRGVFSSFGYGEVITPTLELESALEVSGEQRFRKSFRLFDEKGDVMVLRPEMTTPIARLIATKMADRRPPFRLCYFANSFRPTTPQRGRQSEFCQAGLEFVGDDSPAADAEVLAVLCRALESCGLEDFSIALGEASFFQALLASVGVSGEERRAIFDTLAARDMVELAHIIDGTAVAEDDKQAIRDVVELRGGSEVLTQAQDLVRDQEMEAALKRLARTYYIVSRHGYAGRILFDLGILRGFEYYTGIVFEVLSEGLGFPLGGGGRYNGLLARFGRPLPAVGFAVGLDRLHIAVNDQGGARAPETRGVMLSGGLDDELDLAFELRKLDINVFALPAGTGEDDSRELALAQAIELMVIPEGEDYRLVDVDSGEGRQLSRADLLRAVGR
jgi:ATP phosphoribosyltransferase regulatory subunit